MIFVLFPGVLVGVAALVVGFVVAGRGRPRVRRAGWYVLVSVGASAIVGSAFALVALVSYPNRTAIAGYEYVGFALLGGVVGAGTGVVGVVGAAALGLAAGVVSRRLLVRFLGAVVGAAISLGVVGAVVFTSPGLTQALPGWGIALGGVACLALGAGAVSPWPAGFLRPVPRLDPVEPPLLVG